MGAVVTDDVLRHRTTQVCLAGTDLSQKHHREPGLPVQVKSFCVLPALAKSNGLGFWLAVRPVVFQRRRPETWRDTVGLTLKPKGVVNFVEVHVIGLLGVRQDFIFPASAVEPGRWQRDVLPTVLDPVRPQAVIC